MARPVRSAAIRARELWNSGRGREVLEADNLSGMSSGEEDEIDFHQEAVLEDSLIDENVHSIGGGGDAASSSAFRPKSYGDPDEVPEQPPFRPARVPGPNVADRINRSGLKSLTRAIDFFQLFFTGEVIQMLCENTNLYGWLTILEKPSYATPQGIWEEVTPQEMRSFLGLITPQEMRSFLGLIIMMGFIKIHDFSRYWYQGTLYSCSWAPRFMSKYRFKSISSMLHASNPSSEDPTDRLTKIRPLLEHVKRKCSMLYQPRENLSIDERMVRSKARSKLIQFIPNKPVRFGYKLWCLCQSTTGYTVNFQVYTGRRSHPSGNGLGHDVVTTLMQDFFGQGYKTYFDNFFTSLPLIRYLMNRSTSACGTSLVNRRGFPAGLKDKAWAKRANRGDTRFIRTDNILCQQWMDNRPVCVCSSMHKGSEFVMVRRHMKTTDGSHRPVMVRRPVAIHDYNAHMGGVDISNQRLETYSMLHKSQKWWKTLFYHLVDMSVLNSFLLFMDWKEMHPEIAELQRPPDYSHLQFREELSRQLAGISDWEDHPNVAPKPRQRSHFGFDGVHMPLHKSSRLNCRVCYLLHGTENKTNWICSEEMCNVPICLNSQRNCFVIWHSDAFQELKARMGR